MARTSRWGWGTISLGWGRHTDNSRSSRYRDIGNLAVAIAISGNDRDKWNPKKTFSKIVFCHF